MPRKQKTIHYLYKTTCNITGRWYIGMHSTNNLDDGYMGSGKRLRYSIRKHSENNHTKEILEFFDSRELLVEAEKVAITDDMIGDPMCMNLAEGGSGGHGNRFLDDTQRKKFHAAGGRAVRRMLNKRHTDRLKSDEEYRERWLDSLNPPDWTGKKHTEETKRKMSESSKGMGKGETNSQYGTCWINKDGENKKIKKEVLNEYLELGWVKGRKMKYTQE